MSKAKSNLLFNSYTYIMILKQQISQLQQRVAHLDQDSLIQQLAKNKVLYNLTKRQNSLELTYSYMALAQFYITEELYQPAIKILAEAEEVKQTGDAEYMMALCLYKSGKKLQAEKLFKICIQKQWIQPSLIHRQTSMLQAVGYLQKIQFQKFQKHPDKKQQIQNKLIQLCYQKIKIIKKFHSNKSQNYFYGLAMGDLAQIYKEFKQYDLASQKIKTAIKMLSNQQLADQMLIQFYLSSAKIQQKINQTVECFANLKNAIQLIQQSNKKLKDKKFNKVYQEIYYMYIKKTLGV